MNAESLAFSTNAFTRFPLEEALRGIAAAGFKRVEILADAPHADPAEHDAGRGPRVRRLLDELGLSVCNVNCNCSFSYWRHAPPEPYFEPSLISPVPAYRADRAERIRRAIDFAAEVGSPAVSITSGRCLGEISPESAGPLFRDNLGPVLDYAAAAKVNIGIECEPGLFIEYASELADLIATMGHPRLGANLDTGHSVVLGEDLGDAFTALKGRIWNTHLEDLPGRKHWHSIPGQGTFPWQELLSAMQQSDYAGTNTVELYTHTADPHTAAKQSFEFLTKL